MTKAYEAECIYTSLRGVYHPATPDVSVSGHIIYGVICDCGPVDCVDYYPAEAVSEVSA